MIKVNNMEYEWKEEQSIEYLLNLLKKTDALSSFLDANVTVIMNDRIILPEQYRNKIIQDKDTIRIYPVMYGG